jgi:hypothetical protein
MSKTIILDCPQSKAIQVNNNGDYKVVINDVNTKLTNGSTLSVKNAFIDTTSVQQDKIVIDEDIDLVFNIGKYAKNYTITDKTYFTADAASKPDGKNYLLCNYFSTGAGTGGVSDLYQYIEKLNFAIDNAGLQQWGGTHWTFEYLDMSTGAKLNKSFPIPEFVPNSQVFTYSIKDLKIGIVKGSLQSLTKKGTKNTKFVDATFGDVPATRQMVSAIIEPLTIPLDAGVYDPAQLALTITTALSNNNADKEFTTLIDSKFLGLTDNLVADYVLVNDDASQAYDYKISGKNLYIGASQVELLFNPESSQFYWNFLHFPYYDSSTGTNISVGYLADSSGTNFVAGVNCGVFFSHLGAFKRGSTTETFDFWTAKLGFDITSDGLCPNINKLTNKNITGIGDCEVATVDLTIGKNITNGFAGLDTVVKKGTTVYEEPAIPFDSTIGELTDPIYANTSISTLGLASSHLLLEVTANFQNDLRTSENKKTNIASIISRYYGYENFTSDEGETIVFEHQGEDVFIKDIGIRILNPDFTLANVGDKNHIYLQIQQ